MMRRRYGLYELSKDTECALGWRIVWYAAKYFWSCAVFFLVAAPAHRSSMAFLRWSGLGRLVCRKNGHVKAVNQACCMRCGVNAVMGGMK